MTYSQARTMLRDQEKTGLLAPHRTIAPVTHEVRATVSVIEALRDAGARIDGIDGVYRVTLGSRMPSGIVAVLSTPGNATCLRREDEPPYRHEYRDQWVQADWLPCPVCGAPVVWYEAGYVPGWRVCTRAPHHHSRVYVWVDGGTTRPV